MKSGGIKALKVILPLLFWLIIWELVSLWVGLDLLVPSPLTVARRFVELASTSAFWRATLLTLGRIVCGALCGILLGILCAVLTCRFRPADWLLSPALRVIRAVPVASFIILVLLWFQKGIVPTVISALMVMPVIWDSFSAGIRSVDPQLLEMARSYHMGRWRTLRYVYLPALLPGARAGICTGAGLAWKSGVAAEVLCTPKYAVGTQVYYSKLYLETPSLFAWTITVIVLSLILERLLRLLLRGGKPA